MTAAVYDNTKDPFYQSGVRAARGMTAVSPSDTVDLTKYSIIYALTAGTVVFVPAANDDSTGAITMTVPVGWQSPCLVRRVKASGTSATFATLDKII